MVALVNKFSFKHTRNPNPLKYAQMAYYINLKSESAILLKSFNLQSLNYHNRTRNLIP